MLSGHRFGFNNQEKDNEVAGIGNSYTAEYWQYDARLGRRWNVDPVFRKFSFLSSYATFGNNPIIYIDPNGDELDLPKDDDQAKKDIVSLAKSENRKYIKIDEEGKVSLDWSQAPKRFLKSEKKLEKLKQRVLKADAGLRLINRLVNDNKKYHYSTKGPFGFRSDPLQNGRYGEPNQNWLKKSGDKSTDEQDWFQNASNTTVDENNSNPHLVPKEGYDGQVAIAPGTPVYTLEFEGKEYEIRDRRGVIYHELFENYIRTTQYECYEQAHSLSGGVKTIKYFLWE